MKDVFSDGSPLPLGLQSSDASEKTPSMCCANNYLYTLRNTFLFVAFTSIHIHSFLLWKLLYSFTAFQLQMKDDVKKYS